MTDNRPRPRVVSDDVWVILCAGGTGSRVGGVPKQFRLLGGVSVLRRSVESMRSVGAGVVVAANDHAACAAAGVEGSVEERILLAPAGAERRDSVAAALGVVPPDAHVIAVHDAARPLATGDLLRRGVEVLAETGADGAVPAIPSADTIKAVDTGGRVLRTLDRASLVRVQTPQVFLGGRLRRAHAEHDRQGGDVTDDASMLEGTGGDVRIFGGEPSNIKLTYPFDFAVAEALLRWQGAR